MGYETKILIGKSCLDGKEKELDKEHPFQDGSGFPFKRGPMGEYIETGRTEKWFQIYAELDLCKLGYQDDALNLLMRTTHDNERAKKEVVYLFGTDGNIRYTEDRYGDPMFPVPIKDVLAAMKSSAGRKNKYRRLVWAIALLESMADDYEP